MGFLGVYIVEKKFKCYSWYSVLDQFGNKERGNEGILGGIVIVDAELLLLRFGSIVRNLGSSYMPMQR